MEKAIMFADWIKENGYESDWIYTENGYFWISEDSDTILTSKELYSIFLETID